MSLEGRNASRWGSLLRAALEEKHQTNVRAAAADRLVRLGPAKRFSLEQALEFLREDECVEVASEAARPRRVELVRVSPVKAARSRSRAERAAVGGSL